MLREGREVVLSRLSINLTRPRLIRALLFAIVVTSCLESVGWEVGPATVRPVHVIAIALTALLFRSGLKWIPSAYTTLVLVASIVLLGLVPLLVHRDEGRLLFPGLIVVNIWIAFVTLAAYRAVGPVAERAVSTAFVVILLVPWMQTALVALGALPPFEDQRLGGLGRAPGTFEEATWMGAVAVYIAVWFAECARWRLALAASILTGLVAARTALFTLGAAVVRAATPRRLLQRYGLPLFIVATVGAILFTPMSLTLLSPTSDRSSLDSRVLDQERILASMTGWEWVVGGEELRLYDEGRLRQIPATANNAYVDFLWKQGIFGLIGLALLMSALIYWMPKAAGLSEPPWMQPPILIVVSLMVLLSFANSALLRPWLWTLSGCAIALSSQRQYLGDLGKRERSPLARRQH